MAAGSGTIGIRLVLDGARAAARGFRSVSDAGDRLANNLNGISRIVPFGKIVAGAGLAAGAVGAIGIAAATAGIKTAASMEQASISFTTMLGSAEKADSFIRDLQDFAAKTPFDFPGLQDAASSLISAGIDANKVIPIMTSLGNATSGMGTGAEGIQRATVALQQMSAAQKISGEDLNQLRDAGIPVYDLLAASLGKTKEEVAALAQSGKLGKKELDALMSGLESGQGLERFAGLMDKQSMSLSGLAATFQDTIQMGLAQTMTPLLPTLKGMLTAASALAEKALPELEAGFARIAPTIQRIGDGIGALATTGDLSSGGIAAAFSLSPEQANTLNDFMATFKAAADGVAGALRPVWEGIKNAPVSTLSILKGVLEWMANHTTAVQAMASALATIVVVVSAIRLAIMAWTVVQGILNVVLSLNPIGLIIIAIAALVGGLIVAYQKSETFRGIVDGLWSVLKNAGSWIKDTLFPILKDGFVSALDGVKNGFNFVKDAVTGFVDKIKGAYDKVKQLIDLLKNGDITGFVSNLPGFDTINNLIGGARAEGGPVSAGVPYLVGERGPELVVPRASGTVVNNEKLRSSLSGSMSSTVQSMGGGDTHIYLDGREITANVQTRLSARMARA